MDYDSLLELVEKRRSLYRFKPDPVPDEYINKIIEVARWAPSGANRQPWEFIVIKEPQLKDKIVELVQEHDRYVHKMQLIAKTKGRTESEVSPKALRVAEAPIFILECGDVRSKDGMSLSASAYRPIPNFVASLTNAYIYMHLAATSLGLASAYLSRVHDPLVQFLLKPLLGIPKEIEIFELMAVGFPASPLSARSPRAMEEMVHYGYFDKSKLRPDEIFGIYKQTIPE